jgi:hypothetical protein
MPQLIPVTRVPQADSVEESPVGWG